MFVHVPVFTYPLGSIQCTCIHYLTMRKCFEDSMDVGLLHKVFVSCPPPPDKSHGTAEQPASLLGAVGLPDGAQLSGHLTQHTGGAATHRAAVVHYRALPNSNQHSTRHKACLDVE